MFRRERQQRGRYRQFTQIGIEAFGSAGPRVDAEQIELLDRWLAPLQSQAGVRRDLRKYTSGARRGQMLEVCERLRAFTGPTLVVWTPEDRVQRPEHGRRLADQMADARLVEIPDSYTLIMRDQPAAFARAVRDFVREGRAGAG